MSSEIRAALAELVALKNLSGEDTGTGFLARRKRKAWARARRALGLPEEGTLPSHVQQRLEREASVVYVAEKPAHISPVGSIRDHFGHTVEDTFQRDFGDERQ